MDKPYTELMAIQGSKTNGLARPAAPDFKVTNARN